MESADIHHEQLRDQLLGSSSSSSATLPCYGVGSTTHGWTPTSNLNTNNGFSSYPNETISNPREQGQQENVRFASYSSPMAPDMSINWTNTTLTPTSNQSEQGLQYCLKYSTELLSSSPSLRIDELSLRDVEQRNLQSNDITTKFLLKSFSSGNLMNKINQLSTGDLSSYTSGNGPIYNGRGVGQIFQSVNVGNLNQEGLMNPGSLNMNLQALDLLLTSSRFSGNFSPPSQSRTGIDYYSIDHMQHPCLMPLYSSNKVSANSSNEAADAKRSSSKMELKTLQTAPKKSRLQPPASCQPLKVRKEKLGDRIAALQQLVAPFGKTDTASVLMEAIGYIKFLQSQVETLSVPYMKASRNKTTRTMMAGPTENGSEEPKSDLKSRGLCLVPLACVSYIADGGGAVVWPPPHFGGATQ